MAPKPSASRTATKQTVSRGIAKKAPTIQPKKLFRLSSLSKASSSSSTSSRRGQSKDEKAVITFFRAKYQKGEMKGTFSGNVYMHGKPRYNKKQKSTLRRRSSSTTSTVPIPTATLRLHRIRNEVCCDRV